MSDLGVYGMTEEEKRTAYLNGKRYSVKNPRKYSAERDNQIMEYLAIFKALTVSQVTDMIFFNIATGKTKAYERLKALCDSGQIKKYRNFEGKNAYYLDKRPTQDRHRSVVADSFIQIAKQYRGKDVYGDYTFKFYTEHWWMEGNKPILKSDLVIQVLSKVEPSFFKYYLIEAEISNNPAKEKVIAYNNFYESEKANIFKSITLGKEDYFPPIIIKTHQVSAFLNAIANPEYNRNNLTFLIERIE